MTEELRSDENGPATELSVVVPVYNEGEVAAKALHEWAEVLRSLPARFELRVYDDGSRDDSATVLRRVADEIPEMRYLRHENRGHGPTILRGYHEARSPWIFQTDSDGEMDPRGIAELWSRRDGYDFLFGTRSGRTWSRIRWLVTRASRWSVWLLFGRGVSDVNTPFRLMRREVLTPMLGLVPDDTFAPNVILSGLAARRRVRIYEQPVSFRGREDGSAGSLGSFKVLKPAWLAFRQTLRASRAARKRS